MATVTRYGRELLNDDRAVSRIEGQILLERGEYWIGDLGYVLADEDWDRMGREYHSKMAVRLGSGEAAYIYMTCGDGAHVSSDGDKILVDSGSIGIVPAAAISPSPGLGKIKAFDGPFVCEADYEDGRLRFGDFDISL